MSNLEIARLLKNVATAYIIKDEKKFRFQLLAYQKASETVAGLNSELIDYYKEDKLEALPGIGPTIKSHLTELFKTGKVKHFQWVLEGIPASVFVLTDIPTFGPKKAFKLVSFFKLNNPKTVIEDLKKTAKQGKIAALEGFGEKSQSDILRAIEEYKEGKGKTTRMILPYAFEVAEKILKYLREEKAVGRAEILGSLRRRTPTVGDIDFAVATKDPKKVLEHFVNYPFKERIIEKGTISASILVAGGKQIDLMIQPEESFGSLLQHFTGSKNHNVALRELALKKNLSLSEKGIKNLKTNIMSKFSDEKKFYEALHVSWIPPEIRENNGEIELALKNELPKLIELPDLKGDLHIHSSFPIEPSHDLGQNTMEEMLNKAKELKYEYLGFSEHNPSQSKHTNEKIYELLQKRNEKIEQLKSSNKDIRILKLLETDILPSGELSIDDKSLGLLDFSIVSIHSVFNMDKDKMTARVIKGLSHPKAKILAHPTGRMLNERSGYELDWEKIFEFCKNNNKALEINSWPTRLDLTDTIIKQARDFGVKMVIDSDSHATNQMDMQKYGVFMARRGWATKNDILNTLSYNEFSDWIKK
ncbi:MAG TPA: PHP domain-containing protein [Candidatus Sulfotelmatobacter sp.]|nr:PHP domain-containing protein [Candidatus Sulfotelmatobacter sp.]